MKKLSKFIENYNGAFFVGSLTQKKVVYINKKARTLFNVTENNCDFSKILGISNERIQFALEMLLESGKISSVYNHVITKANGDKLLVDIQLGYFDDEETEVYLELIPQNDKRMQMTINQIDVSLRPEAILNMDETLSIVHCNEPFNDVFDSNERLRHMHFQNHLINGFLPELREKLVNDILTHLETQQTYSTKIKVFSATNDEYWYLLELERRTLDNTGKDKIIAYMTNIEKQVELEENYEFIHQFFEATQNFTNDIIYRIELKTKTLHHMLNPEKLNDRLRAYGNNIQNYIDVLIDEDLIHPDDQARYRKFNDDYVFNKGSECDIRFAIPNDEYEWYNMKCNNIYDENNKLTHIIGTLKNINDQHKIKEENSHLNQYFTVLQELTNDVLYRVEMPSKTLYHSSPNAFGENFGTVVPNHIEEFINAKIIHPEDVDKYKQQIKEFVSEKGQQTRIPIRVAVYNNEYKWYNFVGKKILDNQNNIVEIVGTLINIDEKQKIKQDNSLLNQYLSIVQESTTDILYRVDVENMTLYHFSDIKNSFGGEKVFPNYIETFLKNNIIHPDDQQYYLEKLSKFNETGESPEKPIRFSIDDGDYEWYKVTGKRIYDKNGDLKEVFGALVNVDNEHKIQEKADTLDGYLEALQLISDESFYVLDVKTKTLVQKGKVAEELEIFAPIPNFPESIYPDIHPDDLQNFIDYTQNSIAGIPSSLQMRALLPNKEYQWYELYSQILRDKNGEVYEVVGKMNNIDKGKNIENQFSLVNQYFKAMQELTDNKLFHIDFETKTFYHNDKNAINIGAPTEIPNFVETMIEQKLVYPDDVERFREYNDILFSGKDAEIKIRSAIDKDVFEWFHITSRFIRDKDGKITEIFGTMENIQKQIDLEKKANFDKLTNVLSREAFEDEINKELSNPKPNSCNALIFIDIDDFKPINDTYGHQYGDFVLQVFAKRIGNCIKQTDLFGRVGGDEFVVYLKNIGNGKNALERSKIMLDRMNLPISNGTDSHKLGLSIGISLNPDHGTDLSTLYNNADKAVYASKKKGKNTATLYSSDM